MAHINYDDDQQGRYNSGVYDSPRRNGGFVLLAIVVLLVLFFWADLWQLRSSLASLLMSNPNSSVTTAEGSIALPVTEIRHVTTDTLNMREQPGNNARVSHTLSRGNNVVLLGESHQELNGNVWLKVRVDTSEGTHVGWVSQQYIE